jgi:predicted SAM-dependent methyltransferase/GT2 family glycosyltransferase|tara:strand:+ start:2769 stop:4058 length:1290 start_codon:yes stop_codon:yes gene_type:complete
MKFSLITPVHRYADTLFELYESIKAQTYPNWEWVLYLNGKCTIDMLPKEIQDDDKVKIYTDYSDNGQTEIRGKSVGMIGYYKHHAFMKGTGDVLCEMDHDDLLLKDCLRKLYETYSSDDEIGFVYTDCAYWDSVNVYHYPFDSSMGWEVYKYKYRGQECLVHKSFGVNSVSFGHIWWAPDHIRTWRKDLYHELGGHNVEYLAADDHEILIRTFLSKWKINYLEEVCYIYRLSETQSVDVVRDEIQELTVSLFDQYAFDLALRDCERRGLLAIDLGGGNWSKEGLLNVDINPNSDIVCDLNNGIPLEDNSVGLVNASHVLEHLKDPLKSMSEIHRVLAHGGWAFIEVPSTDGRGAFQDPTHVSFWNQNSFWYYTMQEKAQFIDNDKIRFMEKKLVTDYGSDFDKEHNILNTTAWLICVKDGKRLPGNLLI